MKSPFSTLIAPALVVGMSFSTAFAQDAKFEKLVDLDVKVNTQETPQIAATNVKDKRWKPKTWIEIETSVKAKPAKDAKPENSKTYPELTLKYYVVVTGSSADKTKTLTGEVVHSNVPTGEEAHSVVYISPATLMAITGKPAGGPADITFWGVEASVAGTVVGRASSTGGKDWWTSPKAPKSQPGLLSKSETPFSILWGDYHLDVKGK